MTDLTALARRVEEANGGNDDAAIIERRAINAIVHEMMPEPKVVQPLNYCGSLDAAASLVKRLLPEAFWRGGHADPEDPYDYTATIIAAGQVIRADHDTAPLSLLLAAVRALGRET